MTVAELLNEVDCRIAHGAESGGHLEYVRERLLEIVAAEDDGPFFCRCEQAPIGAGQACCRR